MIFPRLKSILRNKGFVLHTRPYELNIVGVRTRSTVPNRFDDEIHVFYKSKPMKWEYHIFKATTDPGTYWLQNPMQEQGTAILAQGQYVNAYQIGMHRGKYPALVQIGPVSILRDYNRNAKLDFLNGKHDKGFFGINIHRAMAQGKTKYVDKFSAGCQVFQNEGDFEHFMRMCGKHRELYGNRFTYTLLDFRAMRRESIKRIVIGTFTLGLGLIGYIKYDTNE
jgi:hypothetical protein